MTSISRRCTRAPTCSCSRRDFLTRGLYGIGLGADPAKVNQLWAEAKANPIAPVEIPSDAAPVHEVAFIGDELKKPGQGLDAIPVPISTPGAGTVPDFT